MNFTLPKQNDCKKTICSNAILSLAITMLTQVAIGNKIQLSTCHNRNDYLSLSCHIKSLAKGRGHIGIVDTYLLPTHLRLSFNIICSKRWAL